MCPFALINIITLRKKKKKKERDHITSEMTYLLSHTHYHLF